MKKNFILSSLAEYLYFHGYLSKYLDIDSLTGLYNRNFYEKEIPKMVAQAKRSDTDLLVVVVDVDGLKKMNDTYGHKAGDKLIKGLAKLLVKQVRESDMVVRMGGDEFVLILWNSELGGAKMMMERTLVKARVLGINFSFGLALVKKGMNLKKRMIEADEKMYSMKRAGTGR